MAGRIEGAISCPVCTEIYKEPKTLKCGHSVCVECVGRISNGVSLRCPICRRGFQMELGATLPTNLAFRDLIDLLVFKRGDSLCCATAGCFWSPAAFSVDSLWCCGSCDLLVCSTCVVKFHRDHKSIESYQNFRFRASGLIGSAMVSILPYKADLEDIRTELLPAIQTVDRSVMHSESLRMPSSEQFQTCKSAKVIFEEVESKVSALVETYCDEDHKTGHVAMDHSDDDHMADCYISDDVHLSPAMLKEQLCIIKDLADCLPMQLAELAECSGSIKQAAAFLETQYQERRKKIQEMTGSARSTLRRDSLPGHPGRPNASRCAPAKQTGSCHKTQSTPSLWKEDASNHLVSHPSSAASVVMFGEHLQDKSGHRRRSHISCSSESVSSCSSRRSSDDQLGLCTSLAPSATRKSSLGTHQYPSTGFCPLSLDVVDEGIRSTDFWYFLFNPFRCILFN